MNFTLLVVVLLTAIAFVGVVIALSRAISPRSYNAQKFEAYECGIPTRGKSWMQFRVGYYLFAILFLIVGIIGEYIAILFSELKDRPIYIVQETQNVEKKSV